MSKYKRIMYINLNYSNNSRIAILSINRPAALNALNSSILHELEGYFVRITDNSEIRAVIITGIGKAFAAGADIAEMKEMTPVEAKNYANEGARLFQDVEFYDKVTIAAINGFALGGGCELAMACDIRIASDKAKFGQPEVGLGITPGFSGIRRMMEIIGEAKAKEYIFSGRIFDAQEAERIGLVNKVVPAGTLMEECQKIAEEIASKSFNAVITSKKVMNALKKNVDEKVRYQSECFANCFKHKDQKAGMNAFLNKEKPSF